MGSVVLFKPGVKHVSYEINDPSSTSTSAPRKRPTLDPLGLLGQYGASSGLSSIQFLNSKYTLYFHQNSKVNFGQSLQTLISVVFCRGRYVTLGLHSSDHASRMFASQHCSNCCSLECALMIFWMWSCLSLEGMLKGSADSSGTVYNTSLASMSLC